MYLLLLLLLLLFYHIHYKSYRYLAGKVRIGVARPIPLPDDEEEYEESPPDTARYNVEPLLKDAVQLKRGNFIPFHSLLCPNITT